MEINESVIEYFDELYPVTEEQKKFYKIESQEYTKPVKYLSIGCFTGTFEHNLAKDGADVTGIENLKSFIDSASRKRRTQFMSLRFFDMTNLEMGRYLGKGFYDIISILNSRIIFTKDNTLMAKLFYDCRQLLSKNGKLIISLINFEKFYGKTEFNLPEKESIRVKLFTKLSMVGDEYYYNQKIETGSGRRISVVKDAPVNFLTKEKIIELGKKSGFEKINFFNGFGRNELAETSDTLVAVLQ